MKRVVLCIMDGYGYSEKVKGNAILEAKKPRLDEIFSKYPIAFLKASGRAVGLPEGQMGNSEVGHLNIGAGRVIYQDLEKINKAIEDESFYKNKVFTAAIDNCRKNNTNLHIYGILSDGGVHSHINHLIALLELCRRENFDRVFIHPFLDGRDTPPLDAPIYVNKLKDAIIEKGIGKIATIMGRYYAMNRDRNYNLTKMAYDALVFGKGVNYAESTEEAFEIEYKKNLTDEFMEPTVLIENGNPIATIKENDSIIAFNYRSDRMVQLTRAFDQDKFTDFEREAGRVKTHYACMTLYAKEFVNVSIAYEKDNIDNALGEYISKLGYGQIRIAEPEKQQHITYYFNGQRDIIYDKEDVMIVPRPDVFTYDEKPSMSGEEITEEVIKALDKNYEFIAVNFANCDGLGHTGVYEAVVKGVEFLDSFVGRVYDKCIEKGVDLIITADHGNSEQMISDKGEIDKAHTTNPVPIVLCNNNYKIKDGRLCDIAPTILKLMDIEIPKEMTGEVLIEKI